MTIDYLSVQVDDCGPHLHVTTKGCGCCADHYDQYRRDQAIKTLDEYEAELKATLKEVRKLRRQVAKFRE